MSEREPAAVVDELGFQEEIAVLGQKVQHWIRMANEEVGSALRWQFDSGSKFFRPLTIFSCYRAVYEGPVPPSVIESALIVEMFHNVSLIIDDIVDGSPQRRGKATLHAHFGSLTALMVSGYIVADGYEIVRSDPFRIRLLSELLKRLSVAECLQWRLRRQPLGVEEWRQIAGEDTGSMFEICACLGTRSNELRRFGRLLGILYHACDDVGDVKGARALGGGGDEDLRDGILTLPAALAIRDPAIRSIFCKANATEAELNRIAEAVQATVTEAEDHLDRLAHDARAEAARAPNPGPLFAMVEQTRMLSQR
jgi:geranylgeranyl pyrophosphate synthase